MKQLTHLNITLFLSWYWHDIRVGTQVRRSAVATVTRRRPALRPVDEGGLDHPTSRPRCGGLGAQWQPSDGAQVATDNIDHLFTPSGSLLVDARPSAARAPSGRIRGT
jgi:hypothetical protein